MNFSEYKYVVVGAGFLGSTIAERIANELGVPVLLLEKRNHIGGNCHSAIDSETGIEYHTYGTHIFHCSEPSTWEYINKFTSFNNYFHQVLTTYKNKVYQMPINLETINSYYNLNLKPWEVADFLKSEIEKEPFAHPKNFEEKAITLIGRPLYEAFIKGYTMKQWQRHPTEISADILMRLPFRKNYYESYFNDKWQGIPINGFTSIFTNMLSNPLINVQLNTDFFDVKKQLSPEAILVYSGPIDRYYDFCFGKLEWRTIKFEFEHQPYEDYQGTSVMNYADIDIPYTRIHEPRHLHPERKYQTEKTIIIKEYSLMDDGSNPYYPINDTRNNELIKKYDERSSTEQKVIFAGRLGGYKYLDMHHTIASGLEIFTNKIKPYAKKNSPELVLVMPVYNEQDAIATVVQSWTKEISKYVENFEINVYNDGSKDNTLQILKELELENSHLKVHDKKNSGHGPTILFGYKENSYVEWLMQIDSDDEIDSSEFHKLWNERQNHDFLIGKRINRNTPLIRKVISLVARITVFIFYGSGVFDVNCPFRLMRVSKFKSALQSIPENTFTPNIILSGIATKQKMNIFQATVNFRLRQTGEVSIKRWKLLKASAKSFGQVISYSFSSK